MVGGCGSLVSSCRSRTSALNGQHSYVRSRPGPGGEAAGGNAETQKAPGPVPRGLAWGARSAGGGPGAHLVIGQRTHERTVVRVRGIDHVGEVQHRGRAAGEGVLVPCRIPPQLLDGSAFEAVTLTRHRQRCSLDHSYRPLCFGAKRWDLTGRQCIGALRGARRWPGWLTPLPGGARLPRLAIAFRLRPWVFGDSRTPSVGRRPTTFARLWSASEVSRPSRRSVRRSRHCLSGLADRRRPAMHPLSCSACWGPESHGTSQASADASLRSLRSPGISRGVH